jgi:hypothetical protein
MTPADTFNAWVNGLSGLQASCLIGLVTGSLLAAAFWFAWRDVR